jgi:Zn finger protein HypA/HybF involved in hydrogenase expression
VLAEVQQHTTGNRAEIEASKRAECISCLENFAAKEVREWRDEWTSPEKQNRVKRWSAKCPHCGQASVIGDATGLLSHHYAVVVRDIIERQKSRGR